MRDHFVPGRVKIGCAHNKKRSDGKKRKKRGGKVFTKTGGFVIINKQ